MARNTSTPSSRGGVEVKQTRGKGGTAGRTAWGEGRGRWGPWLRSLREARRLLIPQPGSRLLGWLPLLLGLPSLSRNEHSCCHSHPATHTRAGDARRPGPGRVEGRPFDGGSAGTWGGLCARSSLSSSGLPGGAVHPPTGFQLARWPLPWLRRGPVVSPRPVTLKVSDPRRRPVVSGVSHPPSSPLPQPGPPQSGRSPGGGAGVEAPRVSPPP